MCTHISTSPLHYRKHRIDPARFVSDHLVVISMQIAGIFRQILIHGTAYLMKHGNGQIKAVDHINAGFLLNGMGIYVCRLRPDGSEKK